MTLLTAPPVSLVKLFEPWAGIYNDSKLVQTLVLFGHVGGLLIAGGVAVASDRATLRARGWRESNRSLHLTEMAALHRVVFTGLALSITSGLLLLTADIEALWGSWIFWLKMVLVLALLGNGARMQGIETKLRADASDESPYWAALRSSAVASMALWLSITLAGVALINYA